MDFDMNDVTQILLALEQGDPSASDKLLPLVYEELRRLAEARMKAEAANHTLQPTALVHEAYLRLVSSTETASWQTRGHFFAATAEAMRRILIESARRKMAEKHGGKRQRVDLNNLSVATEVPPAELLDLDQALADLEALDPEKAALVRFRFFAGLTEAEAAETLGISRPTASRHWAFARAWLMDRLKKDRNS
jgi:RNA polymerase sigma factor (TIGR02999 family)